MIGLKTRGLGARNKRHDLFAQPHEVVRFN
jgi:hypothetical protein